MPENSAGSCTLNAPPQGNTLQMLMGAGSFLTCWCLYASLSAMMPLMKTRLHLDPIQVSQALTMPVLISALGRVPMGMLTDRFGGKRVFMVLLAISVIPAVLIGNVASYPALLVLGGWLGLSLASLPIGIGFISKWFPKERQGFALGVYGLGNLGQAIAAVTAPRVAAHWGFAWGFWVWGIMTVIWLAFFALVAREAPVKIVPKSVRETLAPLQSIRSWEIGLYYFLTFGGFVALGGYMPTLLTEIFKMTPTDAGLMTAGLVAIQPLMRPVGGSLADRIGSYRVLWSVYPVIMLGAFLMSTEQMPFFGIGTLLVALCFGLGNGATMRLTPIYFPSSVGVVAGLVGAMGSAGGYFPGRLLGYVKSNTGDFTLGFYCLAAFTLCVLLVAVISGSRTPGAQPVPAPQTSR